LKARRAPGGADQIGLDTKITVLVERHLARLAEDGRSPVTLSTYRFAAAKLAKFVGGVRVGEATPPGSMRRSAPCGWPTAPRWPASPRRSCVARCSLP
jgi:hypothetical protein